MVRRGMRLLARMQSDLFQANTVVEGTRRRAGSFNCKWGNEPSVVCLSLVAADVLLRLQNRLAHHHNRPV